MLRRMTGSDTAGVSVCGMARTADERRAADRERYQNDPEYRARIRERQKNYRRPARSASPTELRRHVIVDRDDDEQTGFCRKCDRRVKLVRRSGAWLCETQSWRNAHLKRRYGLDPGWYEEQLARQDGVCAICKKASEKPLHIDHDHETDEVRGLLCGPCNQGIGLFYEDAATLERAIDYLKGYA